MHCLGCAPVLRAARAPAVLGVSQAEVRALLRDGALVRLRQGVLVGACTLEAARDDRRALHELALRAQLTMFEDCVASYESAAVMLGVPVLTLPDAPRLTRTQGAWRGGNACKVRIAPLPAHHLAEVRGVCCTNLLRTAVDIARSLPFADAVVVMDVVLQRTSRAAVAAMIDECAEWAEVGKAGRALAFADAASESPFESISRAQMHLHGLPEPAVQQWLRGASGVLYRVDFYWDGARLIGEADGAEKYDDRSTLVAEKRREDDLREAGFVFVRWSYGDMLARTDETIARIARQLARPR